MGARQILQDMFDRVVVAKDIDQLEVFYDPDFVLTTNGKTQDYAAFVDGHNAVYASPISYAIEYDDQAWVESGDDRVACRAWITTERPGEASTRIEVVLIAHMRGQRIHRVWELTWPDWSQLPAFENY
jgi:hypothetical protein